MLKPGGILAVWTYHVGYIEPPFDKLFQHFYLDILSPYFKDGARLVDGKYTELNLPGKDIESKDFFVSVNWNLSGLLNFIESWSGTHQYKKETGKDPVNEIEDELRLLWGDPEKINKIR